MKLFPNSSKDGAILRWDIKTGHRIQVLRLVEMGLWLLKEFRLGIVFLELSQSDEIKYYDLFYTSLEAEKIAGRICRAGGKR